METNKKDLSISIQQANLYSLGLAIPIIALELGVYLLGWGFDKFKAGWDNVSAGIIYFLIAFVAGIIGHEIIHGFSWAYFGKKPLRAIHYGIQWKTCTPYAHCIEPLEVNAYRIGACLPGILLGVVPALIGIIGGSGELLLWGLIFTLAAGGDMLVVWLIRHVPAGQLIEDHPNRAGCYVIDHR